MPNHVTTRCRIIGTAEFRERMEKFYRKIGSDISKYGQSVLYVFPTQEDPGPPFFYSIGLWKQRLPELLLICALSPENGQEAVNRVAAKLKARAKEFQAGRFQDLMFPDGTQLDIEFRVPVRIHTPKDQALLKSQYTIQASRFFKTQEYPVQQIIFPDKNGKWPGEAGFDTEGMNSQLVLP